MRKTTLSICLLASLAAAWSAWGEGEKPAPAPAAPVEAPAAEKSAAPAQPTPEEVIERLNKPRTDTAPLNPPAAGATAPDSDPRLVGTAPGFQPVLETEGRWMIGKPGHMIPAPADTGLKWMFVYDDPLVPAMILLPCRLLEDMEEHLKQFDSEPPRMTLSGQVSTYRGRNFLMPTLMKLTPDRGNLNR